MTPAGACDVTPEGQHERWTSSPLYLAMVDALAACGLAHMADAGRITEPLAWTRHGDPEWPSPDPVVRLRFQMLWTAHVQQRCGLDPKEVRPTPAPVAVPATRGHGQRFAEKLPPGMTRADRDATIVAGAKAEETVAAIATRVGLAENSVRRILARHGVPCRAPDLEAIAGLDKVLAALPANPWAAVTFTAVRDTLAIDNAHRQMLDRTLKRLITGRKVGRLGKPGGWRYYRRVADPRRASTDARILRGIEARRAKRAA